MLNEKLENLKEELITKIEIDLTGSQELNDLKQLITEQARKKIIYKKLEISQNEFEELVKDIYNYLVNNDGFIDYKTPVLINQDIATNNNTYRIITSYKNIFLAIDKNNNFIVSEKLNELYYKKCINRMYSGNYYDIFTATEILKKIATKEIKKDRELIDQASQFIK